MSEPVHYKTMVFDSARWEGFEFRPGDIIISTPAKCGTTWTQMICALLVFQTPEFGRPLDLISPWLEMLTRPIDGVFADLAAQRHRRFIKSHTPLDGLPWRDDITYVCVGRDPRDVARSWDNHMSNMDLVNLFAARETAVGNDDLAEMFAEGPPIPAEQEIERFWAWVDDDLPVAGLRTTLHHLTTFWDVHDRPNIVLLHYADLLADLDGQMRALAARLAIDVPAERWPELVTAAHFEQMKVRADVVAPDTSNKIWLDNRQFFNKGTSGQWRELLDDAALERYWKRVAALGTDPELVAWVHR